MTMTAVTRLDGDEAGRRECDGDRTLIVNGPFIQAQDKKAVAIAIAQKALD